MSLRAPKSLYPNPNANPNPTTDVTRKVLEHGAARRERGITSTNSDNTEPLPRLFINICKVISSMGAARRPGWKIIKCTENVKEDVAGQRTLPNHSVEMCSRVPVWPNSKILSGKFTYLTREQTVSN